MLRPEPRRGGRRAAAYGPESYEPGPYEPGRNESDRNEAPRYQYGPAPFPPETPYGPTGVPYGGSGAPFGEPTMPYPVPEAPYDEDEPGPPGRRGRGRGPGGRGPGGRGPGGPGGPRGPGKRRGRIRRFFRLRTVRVISALIAVFLCWVALLRRPGADRARRRVDLRQAGRMGPGPLPGPGGDVRRVGQLQPAQGGRQAGLLAGRPVRAPPPTTRRPRASSRTSRSSSPPRRASRCRARAGGGCSRR